MVVAVHGRKTNGILSSDGDFDPDMREALANASLRYGLMVHLPSVPPLKAIGLVSIWLRSLQVIDC
jgi:hypothetical protein